MSLRLQSQTQHWVFCPLKFALHLIFGRHFPLFSLTFQLLLLMSNTGSSFEAFPNENARRVLVFQQACQLQQSLILCANFKVDCFCVLNFKDNSSEKSKMYLKRQKIILLKHLFLKKKKNMLRNIDFLPTAYINVAEDFIANICFILKKS